MDIGREGLLQPLLETVELDASVGTGVGAAQTTNASVQKFGLRPGPGWAKQKAGPGSTGLCKERSQAAEQGRDR